MLTGLDRVGVPGGRGSPQLALDRRASGQGVHAHCGQGRRRSWRRRRRFTRRRSSFRCGQRGRMRWARKRWWRIACRVRPTRRKSPDERLLWIEGRDLASGAARWVPYEVTHADYTVPQLGACLFQATTNGLGAGNHCLRRCCTGFTRRSRTTPWRCGTAPAPSTGPQARRSIRRASTTRELRFVRCSSGPGPTSRSSMRRPIQGSPSFMCLAVPRDEGLGGIEPEIGAGCHADPAIALARALLRGGAGATARVSGARDDFAPESYGPAARATRRREALAWLEAAPAIDAIVPCGPPSVRPDIAARPRRVLAGIERAGCRRRSGSS